MTDKVMLNNYILLLKATVEVYVHGTLESSNENVRQTLKDLLNDTMSSQANTYDLMSSYGWYTVNNIESKEIEKTLSNLEQN